MRTPLVACVVGLALLAGVEGANGERRAEALAVATNPALFPSFSPFVHDYVIRCGNGPVDVSVDAPAGTEVSIDGGPDRNGMFTANVPIREGQAFTISPTTGRGRYFVRCLPTDFPQYTFTRSRRVGPSLFAVSPAITPGPEESPNYVAVFDQFGVPVWWYRADTPVMNAELLANGRIAWARYFGSGFGTDPNSAYEVRELDGTLVSVRHTEDAVTDFHEMAQLPNGNYFLEAYKPRDHVDLTSVGGPSDATVLDAEIQEFNPSGKRVWRWNSASHISLRETEPVWCCGGAGASSRLADGRMAYDTLHLNSIEPDGKHLLVSMRATDAVYRISMPSGRIEWKLGGTITKRSLRVLGDPLKLGSQGDKHDARVLADGTISVYENNISIGLTARVARYRIEAARGTATLLSAINSALFSFCCGSARLTPNGWLVDWAAQPIVDGYDLLGRQTFELRFVSGIFSYRAVPVTGVAKARLRAAMNRMYER